jgi:hypothetical protein
MSCDVSWPLSAKNYNYGFGALPPNINTFQTTEIKT